MALITTQARDEMIALHLAMFNTGPSADVLNQIIAHLEAGGSTIQVANALAFQPGYGLAGKTAQEVAAYLVGTLLTPSTPPNGVSYATDWIVASLNAGLTREQVALEAVQALRATNDPAFADAKAQLQDDVNDAIRIINTDPGKNLEITDGVVGSADIMRITGDQHIRIDFTANDNQVRGADLNGNGVIDNDGKENNNPISHDDGKDYEVVDAYRRNPFNEGDLSNNFLGDIQFDGTGFSGDGVSTNGNIFLGGLGIDTAFGGIGNDFMTGGGIAQSREVAGRGDSLSGGRNADFFFVELSALDPTDGNNLSIDGGTTSDDSAAGTKQTKQDSDWLLFEGSDDDEPVTILLRDDSLLDAPDTNHDGTTGVIWVDHDGDELNDDPLNPITLVNTPRIAVIDDDYLESVANSSGSIVTRSGQTVGTLRDIENFDASGNMYGFLDDIDVSLGGKTAPYVAGQGNNGIGSSAQLNIIGSDVDNIIVGGYDNDTISGNKGNDLLMGGNLNFLINPNLLDILDNGRDEMWGGDGEDGIVFEADGGTIDGGSGHDTLWVTREAFGRQTAALTTDNTLRFDLKADSLGSSSGYGGADEFDFRVGEDGSQDQTNYVDGGKRVDITSMESVIATGLGDIDYLAAGSNNPELQFAYQQNHFALGDVNLDLRGTDGWNTLYADAGDDVIEGRGGDDYLSGGEGNDDFIFRLGRGYTYGEDQQGEDPGDGVDVIHRQADANNDNIWDRDADDNVLYSQDFGVNSSSEFGPSKLTVDFSQANLISANVSTSSFSVKIGGITFAVTDMVALAAASTTAELAALANAAFQAIDSNVTVTADGDIITITDSTPTGGRDISDTGPEGYAVSIAVVAPGTGTLVLPVYTAPGESVSEDRLLYVAYEDRADGELVNDGSNNGSSISLGDRAYAQDLVIDFSSVDYDIDGDGEADVDTAGTRIAESQSYELFFDNLTTQDTVSISVNGVTYSLKVGVDLDGQEIENEMLLGQGGSASSQFAIQEAFLGRMQDFINSFMDDDTAAGQVSAIAHGSSMTLMQAEYNGEETVFMRTPVITLGNASGGQPATVDVVNYSSHEVLLLDFDGRDGNLHRSNVLFLGDTGISRAILETASNTLAAGTTFNTINGSEAIVIDGGVNTLADTVVTTGATIFNNTATNTPLRTDFTVHGDDLLIGGNAADHIFAGTGDDRVIGSLGADVLDGGKSFYKVQVLGEALARVYVLNQWEAQHPTKVAALNGLVISSISRIGDTESGLVAPDNAGTLEVFNDTLQFQQNDFTPGVTRFTVTLNNYTVDGTDIHFTNGGAGTVGVDVNGDGTIESTTTFTNFENIRTVSGRGHAVANDGQGNDTLDVSALSTAAGGISYDLTSNGITAGDVRYSEDASINALALAKGTAASLLPGATVASVKTAITVGVQQTTAFLAAVNAIPTPPATTVASFLASVAALALLNRPTSVADPLTSSDGDSDYETHVIKVDGVENVIGGNGHDLLLIDHSEAAKNNRFVGGLGNDRIEYLNNYDITATSDLNGEDGIDAVDHGIASDYAEATITIALDNIAAVATAATGTDTVTSTGGRVGLTQAVDTLVAVERITLGGNTAQGRSEADTVDVAAITGGAIVDYTNGQIRDLGGVVHVTIEGIVQIENVQAGAGNNTVIVADAAVMATNAREDNGADLTDAENILFMTYLDFDQLVTDSTARKSFAAQVLDDEITQVVNQGEYAFTLTQPGGAADTDRVDYSAELGRIIAAVGQGSATTPQYVIVDGNMNGDLSDAESRIDVLVGVEEIVAAKGESVLDFTTVNAARQITFQYIEPAANPAANGVVEQTIRIADGSGNAVAGLNAFVEKYVYNTVPNNADDATWNRVEGGDAAEVIIYQGSENLVNQAGLDHRFTDDVLRLRGGNNEVRYSGIETSIIASINVTPEDTTTAGVAEGMITVLVGFQDGLGNALVGGGNHFITSHTSDNSTSAGSLKIEGSQDAEDALFFGANSANVFILGASPGVINVNIGTSTSLVLTGFELLFDSSSDDVFDFRSLTSSLGLQLADNAAQDHDTIKVVNDAVNYNSSGANTIDLDNLGATVGGFDFDFDVLDVTSVTATNLILNGGSNAAPINLDGDLTDEVVLGVLSRVSTITDFESMVLTDASVAAGSSFTFNTALNTLTQGSTTISTTANVLSFGGLVLELPTDLTGYGNSDYASVTTGVTVTVVGTDGAVVHGGAGNDTLIGSTGSDTLRGGAGNDTLDGGLASETREVNISGALDAGLDTVTLNLDGLVLTLNEVAAVVDVDATDGTLDILAGAGKNAVGNALVALVNANLNANLDINDGVRFGGTNLISVTWDNTTDLLTFKFAAGTDVVVGDVTTVTTTDGTLVVSTTTEVTAGGGAGNDTYLVDLGSDTVNSLFTGDVLQVSTGATATANGVINFVATASTWNLGTTTINAGNSGSVIDLTLAAATALDDTLAVPAVVATKGFKVVGGAGEDIISGSSKADNLTGGLDNDTFSYGAFGSIAGKTGITAATADVIVDFNGITGGQLDKLQLGTAGTLLNYTEASAVANFATALADATTAMDGTILYYLTSTAADGGLLFIDSNIDGTADAVIKLTGITSANFEFGDIIA